MFQRKIDEQFIGRPNVFSIPEDNLIAGISEQAKDHDETSEKTLWVCRQANLRLNKGKYTFRCTSIPFFGEVIW